MNGCRLTSHTATDTCKMCDFALDWFDDTARSRENFRLLRFLASNRRQKTAFFSFVFGKFSISFENVPHVDYSPIFAVTLPLLLLWLMLLLLLVVMFNGRCYTIFNLLKMFNNFHMDLRHSTISLALFPISNMPVRCYTEMSQQSMTTMANCKKKKRTLQ